MSPLRRIHVSKVKRWDSYMNISCVDISCCVFQKDFYVWVRVKQKFFIHYPSFTFCYPTQFIVKKKTASLAGNAQKLGQNNNMDYLMCYFTCVISSFRLKCVYKYFKNFHVTCSEAHSKLQIKQTHKCLVTCHSYWGTPTNE